MKVRTHVSAINRALSQVETRPQEETQGVDDMRKLMILDFWVLFLSSVVLSSCSSVCERPISQSDIPDLIGKWEGRLYRLFFAQKCPVKKGNLSNMQRVE